MLALSYIFGIGSLICFILVVIKLFKKEGVGLGILGVICALYTFIWGWINHKKQDITTIMIIWSVLIVISLIINLSMGPSSFYNF